MKSVKRITATALMGACIAVGAAGVAAAEDVGGGEWVHGVSGVPYVGVVWSDYFHEMKCHGSTAVGTTTVRDSAGLGEWSEARATRAAGNNQTYWRDSC